MIHSEERSGVERSFRRQKGKWRKIRFLDVTNLKFLSEIITSSCILHNFVLEVDGSDSDDYTSSSDSESDDDGLNNQPGAEDIRNHIAARL